MAFGPIYHWYFMKILWGVCSNSVEGQTWFALFWRLRRLVATQRTKFGLKSKGLNKSFQRCIWIPPIYYQFQDIYNFRNQKISEKMHFLMIFSFFANNSRMKQPTPVFLSYMDFPYAIVSGSTKKIFWVLNKLYMAKREAILKATLKIWLKRGTQDKS